MIQGDLTLKAFLKRYSVNRTHFRETLGLSETQWRRLVAGGSTTSARAKEIYVYTGGHVDANMLAGLDDPLVQQEAIRGRARLDPLLSLDRTG